MKDKTLGFLQSLGKTFMLPVALMAFLGIFLGISIAFTSDQLINELPFLGNDFIQLIFEFIGRISEYAFTYLPFLFAIAVPLGMAKREKGVAAFSGVVGYMIMIISVNFYLTASGQLADPNGLLAESGQGMMLGIQTLDMGVLGGIISGVIVAMIHNRFYRIVLPDFLSFFGGTRFVPIMTIVVMSIVGLLMPFIWIPVGGLIKLLGLTVKKAGPFGPFLFGAGERLLIPLGLHHILVALIRFTPAGGSAIVGNENVYGALNIFQDLLKARIPIGSQELNPQGMPYNEVYQNATAFLSQGKMPTFMFGLPGACLAIYRSAYKINRPKIKGLLISAALTTFVVGVTEPVEFLFLFVSPVLYLFHVFMTGLGFMVMSLAHTVIGYTDGGVIDLVIFGILQGAATRWYLVLPIGLVWFTSYYYFFTWWINKKNVHTPGREEDSIELKPVSDRAVSENTWNFSEKYEYDIPAILENIGGQGNIRTVDNCITRLRLELEDNKLINEEELLKLGAMGVVYLGETNAQIVFGSKVHLVKQELEKYLDE